MNRHELISIIGEDFFTSNIENDEFSYSQVIPVIQGHRHTRLDLRFEKNNLSILVETKRNRNNSFSDDEIKQIQEYQDLELMYRPNNKIISILYNFTNRNIKVWKDGCELTNEITINPFSYYEGLYSYRINDKNKVINTTNELNELLHSYDINEKLRSQFVGSLLVVLNNNLSYDTNLSTLEIRNRIKEKLNQKIENDENRRKKTELLVKILDHQDIKNLKPQQFVSILNKIKNNLIPYIDSRNPKGDDLLNLFFTTFNKYVGKADKNQAFTPTHITDFMCEIVNINKNSRVLDPTCGSGSFLVQAMSKMLADAGNDINKRKKIKANQIFGIEKSDTPFGLATTNMMIHEDGKSNVIQASCFEEKEWIKSNNIDTVLMNPPFNGKQMPLDCPVSKKKKEDATKGLYFVNYIANLINHGLLATILPLQCAIGSDKSIATYKKKILENHTLKAVFSLPDEIFYPGASVNACIMLFELGRPHNNQIPTFFGYYKNDGFIKRKNKGRIEKISWESTKEDWLRLFRNMENKPGLSIKHKVSYDDEWLAEAYMQTDYSKLTEKDFEQTIRDFIAFKVKNGEMDE